MPPATADTARLHRRSGRAISAEVAATFPGTPDPPIDPAPLRKVAFQRPIDDHVVTRLVDWMRSRCAALEAVGLEGFLTGLSGGIDSLVCASLCSRAVGEKAMTASILVGDAAQRANLQDQQTISGKLGARHVTVDGEPLAASLRSSWPEAGLWTPINTETRVIQTLLFQIADTRNLAVCATRNRSERALGRFTEGFYGHVAPLGDFYKSEVRTLAQRLGVMEHLTLDRPGCEGHWYDDEIFGVGYDVIDPLIHLFTVERMSVAEVARVHGIADLAWLNRLHRRLGAQRARINCEDFSLDHR